MKKNIVCILIVSLFLLSGCAFITIPFVTGTMPLKEKTVQGKGRDKILLIDISGIISSENRDSFGGMSRSPDHVARLKEELKRAQKDHSIKALVLRINSPGGTVTASDIMYRELMDFKAQTNVPIVACLMDIAASGGYYIAVASDNIYAHPTTITGSIGVIALKFNAKGLLDKIGVVNETITSAALKDSMSPFRGMSEQERSIMQAVLDELHERFTGVVQAGRAHLSASEIAALSDGRVFTAAQALEAGLVDGIGYLDSAIEAAEQLAGLEPNTRVVMYHRPRRYKNNIYSQSSINLINLGGEGGGQSLPMRFMYLWSP